MVNNELKERNKNNVFVTANNSEYGIYSFRCDSFLLRITVKIEKIKFRNSLYIYIFHIPSTFFFPDLLHYKSYPRA